MRRLFVVTAAFLVTSAAPAAAQSWRVAPDIQFAATARPQAIAVGEFDSDGRQDLAVSDFAGSRTHVRLGNGDGTFRGTGTVESLAFTEDVAVADITTDGNEDLIAAARLPGIRHIAYAPGAGDGSFLEEFTSELPGFAHSLAIGDIDHDGWADLAAAAAEHVAIRFDIRDGSGIGVLDIPLGAPVQSVAIGDFDGNGHEDVVALVHAAQPSVIVLPGTGGRAFEPGKVLPIAHPGAALAVGDIDADGRHDVVVAIPGRDRVLVRLGNGDGTLREGAPDVAVGSGPQAVAVADLDADGREDIVVANSGSDSVSVRLGNGDGTFRDAGELAVGDTPADVVVGDFDADGRQDLATANQGGASVSVRLGAGPDPLAGNLLLNGGFEQGLGARLPVEAPTIPGWITTGGMTFVRYGTHPHFAVPTWLDAQRFGGGRHFLWGGDSTGYGGVTDASQTVAVTGEAEAIDAGRAVASLSAQLGGALVFTDTMTATAEFLDTDGVALGVLQAGPVTRAERRNVTTLMRRAGSAAVPARTRRIRVTLTSRDNDRWSSAIADNVKLTLTTRPPAQPAPQSLPAFGAKTRVTIALAAHRAPVRVRVRNGNAFAVTGTLRGRRFAVAANGRATVRLPLRKSLRRRLQREGRIALRLSAVVEDPAGNRRTVGRRVSVRRVS